MKKSRIIIFLSMILWIILSSVILWLYFNGDELSVLVWAATTGVLFIAMIGLDIKYNEEKEDERD